MSSALVVLAMLASFCGGVAWDRYPWLNPWIDEVEQVDQRQTQESTTTGHPGSCKYCQLEREAGRYGEQEFIRTANTDLATTETDSTNLQVYIPPD